MQVLPLRTLRTNPLLRSELHKPFGIAGAMVTMLAGNVYLCVLSFLISFLIATVAHQVGPLHFVFYAWCMVALAIPPFLATTTALFLQRQLATQQFEAIYLTPLTNQQIVQWLIIRNLRVIWEWVRAVLAITPVLIIAAGILSAHEKYLTCTMFYAGDWSRCWSIKERWDIYTALWHYALVFINLWLAIATAPMVGLLLAVWSKGSRLAQYLAGLLTVICLGLGVVAISRSPDEALRNSIYLTLLQLALICVCYLAASLGIRRPE